MVALTLNTDMVELQLARMKRFFGRRQHSIAYETWLICHILLWEPSCKGYDVLLPVRMEHMMNLKQNVHRLSLSLSLSRKKKN